MRQLLKTAYAVLQAMALLGLGGVGEGIVRGIVKGAAGSEGDNVGRMFRKVVIEELVHGSSLICRDEGQREGQGGCLFAMHRLVRRFILSDMQRGSALWNELYRIALVAVLEAVEKELKKDGKSFEELPYVMSNNNSEISAHAIALVRHHALPAQGAEIRDVAKVEDIHRYYGSIMEFMGNAEEAVQVWERLVDILHYLQARSRRNSYIGRLFDMGNRRNRKRELKSRIAGAYYSLGDALMRNGELNEAVCKAHQSLEMRRAIYGQNKLHHDITASLGGLAIAYHAAGKLEKALQKQEQSLEMYRAIHGLNKQHPDMAFLLRNIGNALVRLGKLDEVLKKHKECLEMKLAIHERAQCTVTLLFHSVILEVFIKEWENWRRRWRSISRAWKCIERYTDRPIHTLTSQDHSATLGMCMKNLTTSTKHWKSTNRA